MSPDNPRIPKISAKQYKRPGKESYIYTYFEPSSLPVADGIIEKFVSKCKSNKISCIIPVIPDSSEASGNCFVLAGGLYERLIYFASEAGIKVGLNIQPIFEWSIFDEGLMLSAKRISDIRSRVLSCYEYYCQPGEHILSSIDTNTLMSLTVFDEEYADCIDLRPYVKNGVLDYFVPQGNYVLKEYRCSPKDIVSGDLVPSVNKLDYKACKLFLSTVLDLMGPRVYSHLGSVISLLHISDICFDAPNRRNWDASFNDRFEKEFGFDPSPYYNALFSSIGEKTPHIKNLFMSLRARMLKEGMIAALSDLANENKLDLIYSLAEPKLTTCSFVTGDSLSLQERSACALLEKAYMYGINSLELSSSAALNFSTDQVCCELFDKYVRTSIKILFNDAINSFARGANLLLTHLPDVKEISHEDRKKYNIKGNAFRKAFCAFAARAQSLLRGGRQVSDIAVLFPVDSMHASVYFYQTKESRFEYPPTTSCNDYMTLLNILSNFCGHDPALLHPDVLNSSCVIEKNKIKLLGDNGGSTEFSVLFIPGNAMINLNNLRKIKEFYDNGGKVVATVHMPSYASEYTSEHEAEKKHQDATFMLNSYETDNDREVRDTIKYIFGEDATNSSLVRKYFENKNDNGGEAYYLCASVTASDGSIYTDEELIKSVLNAFRIPLDVYMSELPRITRTDRFNNTYPEFANLGMHARIPGGGFINYIHKRRDGSDIFFFSNTTDDPYKGTVYIKGKHSPILYDPIANKRLAGHYRHVRHLGEVYTAIPLSLGSSSCAFILSNGDRRDTDVSDLPEVESIECSFLT